MNPTDSATMEQYENDRNARIHSKPKFEGFLAVSLRRLFRVPGLRHQAAVFRASVVQELSFPENSSSRQREQDGRLLRAYHDRLGEAGIVASCHLRLDEPTKAITRLAAEIGAECVVLPTPPSTELPPFGYWWELHKIIRQSGMPIVLA